VYLRVRKPLLFAVLIVFTAVPAAFAAGGVAPTIAGSELASTRLFQREFLANDAARETVSAARRQAREARRRRARRERARYRGIAIPPQLASIAVCESHGNPRAIGGGGAYRGKYQFSYSTWAAVGGSGDPAAASEVEQDYRAALLYQRSGPGQWPVCGA
jgi:hypothetical protein